MDPDPQSPSPGSTRAGLNRIRFLLESLKDLDSSLKKLGSRLLIIKGEPSQVLINCLKQCDAKKLCFEYDTDPYYQALDVKVKDYASSAGIEVFSPVSHTLFSPADIIKRNGGKPPLSYQSFLKIVGQPSWASMPLSTTISSLPPVGDVGSCGISEVPMLEELGYRDVLLHEWTPFKGGESEALKRLKESIKEKNFKHIMKRLQGSIIIASAFQALLGYSGLMSVLLRMFNPVVVAPTIAVVGLSFYSYGFPVVGNCLEIGMVQILLYLRKISVLGHHIFLIYAVSLSLTMGYSCL